MEQLRIGVCDDKEEDRVQTAKLLKEMTAEMCPEQTNPVILTFCTGRGLYESSVTAPFSLVFTDIEMPGVNGFELAERLTARQPGTCVAFISNYQNYIFDAQEYEPLWFVRKSCLEKDLRRALLKYFRKHSWHWVNYKIEDGFGKRNIPVGDIWYFECSGHEVKVVTDSGSYFTYGSLRKTQEKLEPCGFIRTHRNYLVNSRCICHMTSKELELPGGQRLPVGRGYKTEMLERMKKYDRLGE